MIDERYIAVITLWGPAAGAASHHRRKPSAILEHNSLQFFSDSLTHLMHERAGKTAVADFLLSLLLHVDDFHFGSSAPSNRSYSEASPYLPEEAL